MNKQTFSILDGRKKNGGARAGAGRKPKAEEVKLFEKLSPLEEDAIKAMKKGVASGDINWIKLYLSYYVGKPKETKDITINEDVPIFLTE